MLEQKRNRLDREFRHLLRRSPGLTLQERGYLAFVSSYEKGQLKTQQEVASILGIDTRTLRRLQSSLLKKGLIEVEYRGQKKTRVRIVEAQRQMAFVAQNKVPDRTPVSGHDRTIHHGDRTFYHTDRTPVSYPVLERELERKEESSFSSQDEQNWPTDPERVKQLAKAMKL